MRSQSHRWSNAAFAAAVAIAVLPAAADVSAAQTFGRDSVYAWNRSAPSGDTAIGTTPIAQSAGRGTIYATRGGATRVATTVKTRIDWHVGEVYGRAGGPAPLFNSGPKAG